jgi:hypothetical protein
MKKLKANHENKISRETGKQQVKGFIPFGIIRRILRSDSMIIPIKLFSIMLFYICFIHLAPAQNLSNKFAQTIGINPVLPFTGTINAEYERQLPLENISIGLTGWYEFKDVEIRWAYLKSMYYPFGEVMKGLGFGPTLGVITAYRDKNKPEQMENDISLSLGALIQYNWYLGKNNNFLIGAGLGGRAILKNYSDNSPLQRFEGDVRLTIGIAL